MTDVEDKNISMDSNGLEGLLQKSLDEATSDVKEAQDHVNEIAKLMKDGEGTNKLQRYSIMYQEALKVKGIARDRYIKLVRMIQDRIRLKEIATQAKGGTPWLISPETIQEFLDNPLGKTE